MNYNYNPGNGICSNCGKEFAKVSYTQKRCELCIAPVRQKRAEMLARSVARKQAKQQAFEERMACLPLWRRRIMENLGATADDYAHAD